MVAWPFLQGQPEFRQREPEDDCCTGFLGLSVSYERYLQLFLYELVLTWTHVLDQIKNILSDTQ